MIIYPMIEMCLKDIKNSSEIIDKIRWEVTPRVFMDPKSAAAGKPADLSYGYMLYVDVADDKPVLAVMNLRSMLSSTVGYVSDVPEELLRTALQCPARECVSGMYPLGETLGQWLRKELSLS
ncbi:MAG: hypothetical protein OEU95_06255 [Nitrospirota bacterium]|nr:hypothetical protein [Nitrospirota bacterium]